jgi:hypothetical protein
MGAVMVIEIEEIDCSSSDRTGSFLYVAPRECQHRSVVPRVAVNV